MSILPFALLGAVNLILEFFSPWFLTHHFCVRLQAALPFVVYPIFAAMDLFGTYQGLKHVHLQTLTKVGFVLFNFPGYLEAN